VIGLVLWSASADLPEDPPLANILQNSHIHRAVTVRAGPIRTAHFENHFLVI